MLSLQGWNLIENHLSSYYLPIVFWRSCIISINYISNVIIAPVLQRYFKVSVPITPSSPLK